MTTAARASRTILSSLNTSSVLYRAAMASMVILATGSAANALPSGATVQAGTVSIEQPTGTNLVVNQSSNRAVIDWRSFDIMNGESTRFNQPGTNSVTLNRVGGGSASQILGNLSANGKLIIINPNGIVFGQNSRVDVAGLVATTADVTNQNFMAGRMQFTKPGKDDASIINKGTITAADGGLVALVAPGVRNDGVIQANYGTVTLGSAQTVAIDMYGDNLYSFALGDKTTVTPKDENGNAMDSAVENNGKVIAQGGRILLTASAAKDIVTNVINNKGVLEASSAHVVGGAIVLDGGNTGVVNVGGKVTATGKTGGSVTATGQNIALQGAEINASGTNGGGSVRIGGNAHGAAGLAEAETVSMDAASSIDVSATDVGNAGEAVLWSKLATQFDGAIRALGGARGGNGGFVETSGGTLGVNGSVIANAVAGIAGKWLLDPLNIEIVNTGSPNHIGGTPTNIIPNGNNAKVSATSIRNTLQSGADVTVTTQGTVGAGAGNITVTDGFTWSGVASLVLDAINNIVVNSNITANGSGSVILAAGNNVNFNAGSVTTKTGNIALIGKKVNLNGASTLTSTKGDIIVANSGTFFSDTANVISTGFNGGISINQVDNGSIQNAIDAIGSSGTAGSTLNLASGTWNEQVTINKDNFTLQGQGNSTVIEAPTVLTAQFQDAGGNDIKSVVTAKNADNVTIADIKVDGLNRAAGNYRMAGVGYNNASGTIKNVTVTNTREPIPGGSQQGYGVYLQAKDGVARNVVLKNSSIKNFQKNGVVATGANLTADVKNNHITGAGPINYIAQNGIVFMNNATGNIDNNTISDIGYTGANTSGDILLFGAGSGIVVNNNHITGTGVDAGIISVNTQGITVTNNDITGAGTGAEFDDSGVLSFSGNTINGGSDGLYLYGNTNFVFGPTANNFNAQTGNFITLDGVLANSKLDISDQNFALNSGDPLVKASDLTDAQSFALRDQLSDRGTTGDTTSGLLKWGSNLYATMATTIQAIIDGANAGETIKLAAGTYNEALNIGKDLSLVGSVDGTNHATTIITSPASLSTQFQDWNGNPIKPIIYAHDAASINLSNLVVDGLNLGNANNRMVGIGYNNAGGSVTNSTITNIQNNPVNGVQHGVGIFALADNGTNRTLTVDGNTINNFQKNGMVLAGANLTADVKNNVVTGPGSVNYIARNGIQFIDNAKGSITNNTISGIGYTGANSPTGIMLYGAGTGITVDGNHITGTGSNDIGIFAYNTQGLTVTNNDVTGAAVGAEFDDSGITDFSGNLIKNGVDGLILDGTTTFAFGATANTFDAQSGDFISLSDGAFAGQKLDIGSQKFAFNSGDTATAASGFTDTQSFALRNKIYDKGNDSTAGLLKWGSNLYATVSTALQDIINGADSGDTIKLAAGNYNQSLDIGKTLNIVGSVDGSGNATTVIDSPTVLASNFTDLGGHDVHSIIYAHDADGINLSNLTVDGKGLAGANSYMVGIAYNNAGGSVTNSTVTGVRQPTFSGGQTGVGIMGNVGGAAARTLTVDGNKVVDFQKNGIVMNGANLTANVKNNTVTGQGATTLNAQNGIIFNYGAKGTIDNNTISAIGYTPSYGLADPILILNGGDGIVVNNNHITGTGVDGAIYAENTNNLTVTNNDVTNSGIAVEFSDSAVTNFGGNTLNGGVDGLILDGTTTLAFGAPNVFNAQSGNFITLSGGAFAGQKLDVGNQRFALNPGDTATAASGFTDAQSFALRDKLSDKGNGDSTAGLLKWGSNLYATVASSIQNIINGADSGDTIKLAAGTYGQSVNIDKNLTLIGSVDGSNNATSIIQSPTTLTNSFIDLAGRNVKPVVYVHDANVNLSNLVVDGNGMADANSYMAGIGYYNAGGTITNSTVTGVRGTVFNGGQNGVGIIGNVDNGTARTLTVDGNKVVDFQKNGIVMNGANLTANVKNNTVTGQGATTLNAQNGIIFNYGAKGTIDNNTISAIGYTPSYGLADPILILNGGDGIVVNNNHITGTGVEGAIYAENTNNLTVTNNDVTNSGVAYEFDDSDGLVFSNNTATNSNIGLVLFNSNNATLSGDVFTGNVLGIDLDNSSNTTLSGETLNIASGGTGLLIEGGSGNTTVRDSAFNGGAIAIALDGAGSSMQFAGNGSSFTGNDFFFVLQNHAMEGLGLDASEQTFNGAVARNFTPAQWVDAYNRTVDFFNDVTVGEVFYSAITDNNALEEYQRNRASLYRTGLFSAAGKTLAHDGSRNAYSFQLGKLDLSLLSQGNANFSSPTSIAEHFATLAPAAGGGKTAADYAQMNAGVDAEKFAQLSPAAGGAGCGNSFLGSPSFSCSY